MNAYAAKAAQFAVMSEFVLRGFNVAVPEMGVTDALFVIDEKSGTNWRVEVMTGESEASGISREYRFMVRNIAITTQTISEPFFVFVMRVSEMWRYAIVRRTVLYNYVVVNDLGLARGEFRQVNLKLEADGTLTSGGVILTSYLDAWDNVSEFIQSGGVCDATGFWLM